MTKKIKILVSYHKPATLLVNEILTPIHLGRALSETSLKDGKTSQEDYQWMLDNMIGDDTGDNISHLNPRFCELTAMYWAWKNQDKLDNPDYIGFMHYRRHLSFNTKKTFDYSSPGWIDNDVLDYKYISMHNLTENKISDIVLSKDVVAGKAAPKNPYKQYQTANEYLHIEDYDLALKILKDKYPEMTPYADKYNAGKKSYFCNLFVMKKEIFNEYCKILFDVLFELDKKINYENYGYQEARVIGYISERLTGIYFTFLTKNKKANLQELSNTRIKNTEIVKDILPAFDKKNIPIVFASDNNYSPYLGVTLFSLLKNISKDNNYDIVILDSKIKEINKLRINSLIKDLDNVSIRYFNIDSFYQKYNSNILFTTKNYSLASFNRFFIPNLFHNYDKIIYFNTDLLIFEDIVNLYNIDLEDNLMGVVSDIEYFQNRNSLSDYCTEKLEIESVFKYFNSGVLLFNIQKCLLNEFLDKCLKQLRKVKEPICAAQCIINSVCKNKVKYMDWAWNAQYHIQSMDEHYYEKLPQRYLDKYNECLKNPKILHFTSGNKPWNNLEMNFADIYWEHAKMTPFYEQIIYANAAGPAFNWLRSLDNHLHHLEFKHSKRFKFRFFINIKNHIITMFKKLFHILYKIINRFCQKIRFKFMH